jgi:hypothetical protein
MPNNPAFDWRIRSSDVAKVELATKGGKQAFVLHMRASAWSEYEKAFGQEPSSLSEKLKSVLGKRLQIQERVIKLISKEGDVVNLLFWIGERTAEQSPSGAVPARGQTPPGDNSPLGESPQPPAQPDGALPAPPPASPAQSLKSGRQLMQDPKAVEDYFAGRKDLYTLIINSLTGPVSHTYENKVQTAEEGEPFLQQMNYYSETSGSNNYHRLSFTLQFPIPGETHKNAFQDYVTATWRLEISIHSGELWDFGRLVSNPRVELSLFDNKQGVRVAKQELPLEAFGGMLAEGEKIRLVIDTDLGDFAKPLAAYDLSQWIVRPALPAAPQLAGLSQNILREWNFAKINSGLMPKTVINLIRYLSYVGVFFSLYLYRVITFCQI